METFLKIAYCILSAVLLVSCGTMALLGVFVRRGGRLAAIAGAVLSALAAGFFALQMFAALARGIGAPAILLSAVLAALLSGACVLLTVWLIQAANATRMLGSQLGSQRNIPAMIEPGIDLTSKDAYGWYGGLPPPPPPSSPV